MDQKDQKKLASAIVLKAREECRKRKIDPYIAVGAFIDETIRELSKVNSDEKVAEFLISIAGKVKLGMYKKKKST
tara:strand:+ start:293 stop:517 length:225 start_codon:yes stop_codon:yes gene_type:complete